MNRFHLLLTACCFLLTSTAFAQLKFTVKSMSDAGVYGVYVKPCGDITPTSNTITGTGQATVVLPLGTDVVNLTPYSGIWLDAGVVSGPSESPNNNYFSFGFLADSPKIVIESGEETLLFSFLVEGNALGGPKMLDNENDPFAVFPNSANTNPGNELSMIDFGVLPVGYYYYSGNYSEDEPTSCQSAPIDTTVVDPVDSTIVDPIDSTLVEPTDTTITVPTDTTSNNGGTTTSTLDEMAKKAVFTLSPNPTSYWINVEFSNVAAYSQGRVRLLTAQGIAIGEMPRNGHNKLTMNVGEMPSGIYFISFEVDGKVVQRERFIKQ